MYHSPLPSHRRSSRLATAVLLTVGALALGSALPPVALADHAPVLTVTKSPTEGGTVTGEGIDCGSDCTEAFQHLHSCERIGSRMICEDWYGSTTLTAAAAVGWEFEGWTNCPTIPAGNTCNAGDMTVDKTVTARFRRPQCSDGTDNEPDGRVDYPADPGCDSAFDDSEGPDPQCGDRVDNDRDARTDYREQRGDPGCDSDRDASESPNPQCSDGVNNDGDLWTDSNGDFVSAFDKLNGALVGDPGCTSEKDDSESPNPQCSDGVDNDGDGWVDAFNGVAKGDEDPGCESIFDDSESPDPDTTDPDTAITGGPPETTNDPTPTFDYTGSDDRSADSNLVFSHKVDAGQWSAYTPAKTVTLGEKEALTQGAHTFYVRARDEAGNVDETPAQRTFVLDTEAADTTIVSGPSGTVRSTAADFRSEASDGGTRFRCRIDGGQWEVCLGDYGYSGLSQGSHTFEVAAWDGADNVDPTPAKRTWTVDTTPPDTSITTGPSGTVRTTSARFGFSSSESGSNFECRRDRGAWSACASPKGYSSLSQGTHTFEVAAIDPAGNRDATPAKRTWKVDTVAPRVTTISPSSGATGVSPTANLFAAFSEAMKSTTITRTTVKLVRKGTRTPVAASVVYDAARRRAKLDPRRALTRGATYTATVTRGAKDLAGNPVGQKTWSFAVRR